MEMFGKFIVVVLAIILNPIIQAFVFSKLWLWFIVPIVQIQPLRIVEAIGIMLIIRFNTMKIHKEEIENKNEYWKRFIKGLSNSVLLSVVVLLFGWVITLFL